ncbi:MAG: hypothetical protein U5L07_13095 [Desulfobacterales bacterium]|nr:hypothetical protein [Desulfobacterales bacterium]
MIKPYQFRAFVISAVLMMVCLAVFTSKPINALTPLDEEALIELSPSLMEEIEEKEKSLPPLPQNEFKNAICFKRCHTEKDFSPSQKTRKQWIILIEKNGHAIFRKIPWESPEQKDQILIYLLRHARDANGIKEGIGIWD